MLAASFSNSPFGGPAFHGLRRMPIWIVLIGRVVTLSQYTMDSVRFIVAVKRRICLIQGDEKTDAERGGGVECSLAELN